MRTNIEIDDALMSRAMQAGPYKTKKDAVEAGLKLLARQAAYREILKWEGKLRWEGDEAADWSQPPHPQSAPDVAAARLAVAEPPPPRYAAGPRLESRAARKAGGKGKAVSVGKGGGRTRAGR